MRFTIPYATSAEFVLRGRRVVEEATISATVMVDIQDISTPVSPAFVLGHIAEGGKDSAWRRFRFLDGRPARVWRIDGDLFAEYCLVGEFIERVSDSGDNPFDVVSATRASAIPFQAFQRRSLTSYEHVSKKSILRRWKAGDEEAKGNLISRRARAMRIIDGHVCVRVNEPLVVVGRPPGKAVSVIVTENSVLAQDGFVGRWELLPERRFRLDRLEEAQHYAGNAGLEAETFIAAVPEDCLFFPQEAEHLHLAANGMALMLRAQSSWLPREVTLAALGLEEVLGHCPPRHVVTDLVPALLNAMELLTELASDRPCRPKLEIDRSRRRDEKAFRKEIGRLLALDRETIRKWEERPRNDQEWCDSALPVAAYDGVYQVLSLFELAVVGLRMQVAVSNLIDAHAEGRIIVHYEGTDGGAFVGVLTMDLDIEDVMGVLGRQLRGDGVIARLDGFISENKRKWSAASDLGTLVI